MELINLKWYLLISFFFLGMDIPTDCKDTKVIYYVCQDSEGAEVTGWKFGENVRPEDRIKYLEKIRDHIDKYIEDVQKKI